MLHPEQLQQHAILSTPPSHAFFLSRAIYMQILAVQSVARTNFASTTAAEEALGRELLNLLGRSPSSANAFHLCVQLGLMKHHENLFAREAGVEKVGCGCVVWFVSIMSLWWKSRSCLWSIDQEGQLVMHHSRCHIQSTRTHMMGYRGYRPSGQDTNIENKSHAKAT